MIVCWWEKISTFWTPQNPPKNPCLQLQFFLVIPFSFISLCHESSLSHSWCSSQPSHKSASHVGQLKACRPQQLCQLSLILHSQRSVLPSAKHSLQWDSEKSGQSVQGTCVLSGPRSAQESHHTSMHTSHSKAFSSLHVHFWHSEHWNASRLLKKMNWVYKVSTYSSTFASKWWKKRGNWKHTCLFPKWWSHGNLNDKSHGQKKKCPPQNCKKTPPRFSRTFSISCWPFNHFSTFRSPFFLSIRFTKCFPQFRSFCRSLKLLICNKRPR